MLGGEITLARSNIRIRIENAPPGCQNITSLEHARRYVKKGRAIFTGGGAIKFLDSALQRQIHARAERELHAKLTNGGYDSIDRVLTVDELRKLVIHPERLFRRESSPMDFSYKAGVFRSGKRQAYAGATEKDASSGSAPPEVRQVLPKPTTKRPPHELAGIIDPALGGKYRVAALAELDSGETGRKQ